LAYGLRGNYSSKEFPTAHREFSSDVGSGVVEHGMQHLTEATPGDKVDTDSEKKNDDIWQLKHIGCGNVSSFL